MAVKKKTSKKTVKTVVNKSSKKDDRKDENIKKKPSAEEREKIRERKAATASWIMALMGIVLMVLMVFDLVSVFSIGTDPSEAANHSLSYVGFWIFHILYGVFGYAVLAFPFILVIFGVFWREIVRKGAKTSKIISCIFFVLLANVLAHIIVNWGALAEADPRFPGFAEVLSQSHALKFGGYISGFVGYILKRFIAFPGAITVCVIGMLVSGVFLFNLDPSGIMDAIRAKIGEKKEMNEDARKIKREYADRDREEKSKQRRAEHAERVRASEEKKRAKPTAESPVKKTEKPAKPEPVKTEEADEYIPTEPTPTVEETADVTEAAVPDTDVKAPTEDDRSVETVFPGKNEATPGSSEEDLDFDTVFGNDTAPADNAETDEAPAQECSKPADEEAEPYVFPPIDLLKLGSTAYGAAESEVDENIAILKETFNDFNIKVREITCTKGPTVTRYEVKPEAGVRVRQISGLQDDIALSLAKSGVRIEAPIPGKAAVGIEVPNEKASAVNFRNIIDTPEFAAQKSKIAVGLGVDVSGKPIYCDLEKMPHLLIAGTTGSGKSVCINSIIMSIIYHSTPDDVKMVLIDPKKVEFTPYRDMPYLYTPIVTEPKRAAGALASMVSEMEHRFELIESVGARNITGYNEITKNDPERKYLPRIVIIIDELADLMMTAKADVENSICRIAQKARAAGIHLVIGTQRPSVDVITGLIKANVPSRIAFTVVSQVDSRTIIDIAGAEKLCGRGDMLYSPVGAQKPMRAQGAFVSDGEIEDVISFVKSHNPRVHYDDAFIQSIEEQTAKFNESNADGEYSGGSDIPVADGEDPKLYDALKLAIDAKKVSTSLMQRKLGIGYGRAAKILDTLEEMGYISAPDGNKPREILITPEQFAELMTK